MTNKHDTPTQSLPHNLNVNLIDDITVNEFRQNFRNIDHYMFSHASSQLYHKLFAVLVTIRAPCDAMYRVYHQLYVTKLGLLETKCKYRKAKLHKHYDAFERRMSVEVTTLTRLIERTDIDNLAVLGYIRRVIDNERRSA